MVIHSTTERTYLAILNLYRVHTDDTVILSKLCQGSGTKV